jgi:hypothetical protein
MLPRVTVVSLSPIQTLISGFPLPRRGSFSRQSMSRQPRCGIGAVLVSADISHGPQRKHLFYCGDDPHARNMFTQILDFAGIFVDFDEDLQTEFDEFPRGRSSCEKQREVHKKSQLTAFAASWL